MNGIFVAMLYGPAIPILFPICLLKLIAFYACERFLLAYSYRMPPTYDETINKDTISLLSWAPLYYAFSAAIFFSN